MCQEPLLFLLNFQVQFVVNHLLSQMHLYVHCILLRKEFVLLIISARKTIKAVSPFILDS